ncbi:SLATT domain-containing protein [Rhodobacter sp. KR11]|uniref:SLATT domain-containing protein n=1 Tax=Rhodobacter sp. KR11 TaxID=2974588 RepID=UPI002222D082|nr:SLATT domain-containing protein [Rhodobacter sp. KR11]MCW1918459.1 SLATT domain-containing protein [Rhodobacter sp. KR11]
MTEPESVKPKHRTPFEDLARRVEMTRDARFQANLRLERRQRESNLMVSILSLFVIFLSLIPNFRTLAPQQSQLLLALSVVNSIFIIITSLLESSGGFQLKGEALHRSARKIAAVYSRLMLLTPEERSDATKIGELQQEYQSALDDCAFNHDNLDHYGVVCRKPSLSSSISPFWRNGFVYPVRYFIWEKSWMSLHISVLIVTGIVVWMSIFPNEPQMDEKIDAASLHEPENK